MRRPAAIIADDLSGALEVGGAFHTAGFRAAVPAGLDAPRQPPRPADVLVIDTETRNAPPEAARRLLRRALRRAKADAGELIYKKIDSTLRGPVGPELAELLARHPDLRLLVTPANPAAGRTVRDGVLCVDGTPVDRTAFGRDRLSPAAQSNVLRLLESCGIRAEPLPMELVRRGEAACVEALNSAFEDGAAAAVADAETRADLAALAAAVRACEEQPLPVGSGGLAREVAFERSSGRPPPPSRCAGGGAQFLFVCGSTRRTNWRQADELKHSAGVPLIELDAEVLAETRDPAEMPIERARAAMESRGAASLFLTRSGSRARGPDSEGGPTPEQVAAGLARLVAEMDRRQGLAGLFVTGGETARAVYRELGAEWFRIVEELEPGLVAAEMPAGDGRGLAVVTKPGGFGDAGTMLRAWRWLRQNATGDGP
ncbi:MAG: four-carbon acid sugar kinase family protein [Planctomycetota bacterium]